MGLGKKLGKSEIGFQVLPAIPPLPPSPIDLMVNGFTAEESGWQRIGSPEPLLDICDDSLGYVRADSGGWSYDRNYTFQKLPEAVKYATITDVKYIQRQRFSVWSDQHYRVYLWDGSVWTYILTISGLYNLEWNTGTWDCFSVLNTFSKINNTLMYLRFWANYRTDGFFENSCGYLRVFFE